MKIFGNLKKKSQVFGNFLTVKWQFSGGSALYILGLLVGTSNKIISLDDWQKKSQNFPILTWFNISLTMCNKCIWQHFRIKGPKWL